MSDMHKIKNFHILKKNMLTFKIFYVYIQITTLTLVL